MLLKPMTWCHNWPSDPLTLRKVLSKHPLAWSKDPQDLHPRCSHHLLRHLWCPAPFPYKPSDDMRCGTGINCTSCFLYMIHIWDKKPAGRKRSSNRYGISEVHRLPKTHQARSLTQRNLEDRIPGRSWTWPCAPSTSHKSQCSLPKAPQEGHIFFICGQT